MNDTNANAYTFEVHDITWAYVLGKLINKHVPKEASPEDITIAVGETYSVYYVNKDLLPAEAIAKAFGATVDAVQSTPVIRLNPIASEARWQRPTVSYWGEA